MKAVSQGKNVKIKVEDENIINEFSTRLARRRSTGSSFLSAVTLSDANEGDLTTRKNSYIISLSSSHLAQVLRKNIMVLWLPFIRTKSTHIRRSDNGVGSSTYGVCSS